MEFKQSIQVSTPFRIVGESNGSISELATLELITEADLEDDLLVKKITQWRNKHRPCFLTEFVATESRTKSWLESAVVCNPSRALFKILDKESAIVGHIGAIHRGTYIEYDYFILEQTVPIKGLALTMARQFLVWICAITGIDDILGNVRSDNAHALDFHRRTGFEVVARIPLERFVCDNGDLHYRATTKTSKPDMFIVQIAATSAILRSLQSEARKTTAEID